MRLLIQAIAALRDGWQPRRDRVLWAPVFLGIGIALYFSLAREPALAASASLLAAAVLAWLTVLRKAPDYAYPLVAVCLAALGFMAAQMRTELVAAPMLDRAINFTRVEGRVQDITVADITASGKAGRKRVTLDSLIIEKLPPERTPKTVRLSSYHVPDDVVPGDRIALLARLMPPSGPVAPDGFSFRRQAFFQGLGATGFSMGHFELISKADAPKDVWFNRLRQIISARISAEQSYPQSAVSTALLAGERSSIPDSINADLRDSGLYHLLSISGLHVAIVCGVTFFLLRFLMALSPYLALHWPIKKIAALAALGAGLFYCLLAGMPVPTQRSILMTGLMLLAVMLDRTALSMRTVALAAFFVLLFAPESLVGASFQLSFAAVISMVAFYGGWGRQLNIQSRDQGLLARLALYVFGIVATTVIVSLATLPPVLHHFGRLQLYGVAANAIAIPLTTFVVMPAGMAALFLMPLHLERPFLKLVEWGIDGTLWSAHWAAHLPHAAIALPSLPMGWYLACSFGFLVLCLWPGRARWLGLMLMIGACWCGFAFGGRPVAMLDAQGQNLGLSGGRQIAYVFKAPPEFVRGNWKSLWGGVEANGGKPITDPVWQDGRVAASCDDFACRITARGQNLSVLRSANALFEECNWAGMLVSLDRAVTKARQESCPAQIVTSWDVYSAGGMAFYEENGVWRAQGFTPKDERRPWTLRLGRN